MSRWTTLEFSTSRINAGESESGFVEIPDNSIDIGLIHIVPSLPDGAYSLFFYEDAAETVEAYSVEGICGEFLIPTDAVNAFILPYEDRDSESKLHWKIVNSTNIIVSFSVSMRVAQSAAQSSEDLVDHADSHENGGGDEINVAGLTGLLATPQTPAAHKTSHQDGGSDELSVAGLSGLLATAQIPIAHKTSHENGGSDEINVAGLSGALADPQTPVTHATSHQNGGSDEISVLGLSGLLADGQTPLTHHTTHESGGTDAIKIDDLAAGDDNTDLNVSTSKHGLAPKLPGNTTTFLRGDGSYAAPAAVTPAAHASSHQDGGSDEISVAALSGVLADAQKVAVQKDAVAVGTQAIINFITGSNTTLTVTDSGGKINVTVAATASGGGEWFELISAVPVTSGKVFSNTHVSAGSGMKYVDGMGVMASLDGDAVWALVFKCPQTNPSGTRKLDILGLANATSGNAKINVKWASAAYEEDWSSLTLNAEGTSTVSWGAGDNDQPKNLQITLDADTFVGGEYIIMNLTFETSSWTLAQVSTWKSGII